MIAAFGFLGALPEVLLVLPFQKYMVQGLTAGFVKGLTTSLTHAGPSTPPRALADRPGADAVASGAGRGGAGGAGAQPNQAPRNLRVARRAHDAHEAIGFVWPLDRRKMTTVVENHQTGPRNALRHVLAVLDAGKAVLGAGKRFRYFWWP